MTLIGRRPGPRLFISSYVASTYPEAAETAARLVPTFVVADDFREVRAAEWDYALVTSGAHVPLDLCAIFIDEGEAYAPSRTVDTLERSSASGYFITVSAGNGLICHEFVVPEFIEAEGSLSRLVHEQLVPTVRGRGTHSTFGCSVSNRLVPFVLASNRALAGLWRRSDDSEGWVLPSDLPSLSLWLPVAFERWHELWPERFPRPLLEWRTTPKWRTPGEEEVVARLDSLRERRATALVVFDSEREALEGELTTAIDAAELDREILTEKGKPLVDAVARSLRELGFVVEDRDETAEPGQKLEDLRITDPLVDDWIAIAEVRGYNTDAAVNDLLRIQRFAARFRDERDRWPSARWYVVNQRVGADPDQRPVVLHANDSEVEAFGGDDDGLVFDTTQLFQIQMEIRSGRIDAEDARKKLREARGRPSD